MVDVSAYKQTSLSKSTNRALIIKLEVADVDANNVRIYTIYIRTYYPFLY